MRIDHHAYQRATRVASVGLLLQLVLGLVLLIFGVASDATRDTSFVVGSLYVLLGLVPWAGLLVLFHQHKLERLEALEVDELASRSGDSESVFERDDAELRVAARRLQRMHGLFMPIVSVVVALLLAGIALVTLRRLDLAREGEAVFHLTDNRGWAVAICLAFAALAFIFSRFVAGMAKLPAWQNLRGGAAWMVGTSLVSLAVAVGIVFRFFDNETVSMTVATAIPIFMIVLAAEIALNFVLNLYRPRVAGETPRPAFDSKLLSLLAAPDNIVRTINEAVNYQFGFDITSSWGYQLVLRSFGRLVIVGAVVTLLLNTLVVVEPNEQAIRLRFGSLVFETPSDSGVVLKLPWPVESAERFDVSGIRSLHLTSRQQRLPDVQLFTQELTQIFDVEPDPIIVGPSDLSSVALEGALLPESLSAELAAGEDGEVDEDGVVDAQAAIEQARRARVSLIDSEIVLRYRILEDGGLMSWLDLPPDERRRRQSLTERERTLKAIALREVSQHLSTLTIDEILAEKRLGLAADLAAKVQAAFDRLGIGVQVIAIDLPLLRPSGEAAGSFEEYSVAVQRRRQRIANGRQQVAMGYAEMIGAESNKEPIVAAIDRFRELQAELGPEDERTIEQRLEVERLLKLAGGAAATTLAFAERDYWVTVLDTAAQAKRLEGQVLPYRVAPELYRQRELMAMYARTLPALRKYVLGIDPSQVNIDFELKELDPLLQITDALGEESGGGTSP